MFNGYSWDQKVDLWTFHKNRKTFFVHLDKENQKRLYLSDKIYKNVNGFELLGPKSMIGGIFMKI